MFSSTPKDAQMIDTSPEPRLSDVWHSEQAEIAWLRSKVLSLQLQIAARETGAKVTEWVGGVLGAIGAALLATDYHPGFGFAFFLASNAVWIRYAKRGRLFGLLSMQVVFTVTSVIGLWNWWLGRLVLATETGRFLFAVFAEFVAPCAIVIASCVLLLFVARIACDYLARAWARLRVVKEAN